MNTTVVACCQVAPAAGSATITAECRLEDALDKAISPISNVHADRRPELYQRITENSRPRQPDADARR